MYKAKVKDISIQNGILQASVEFISKEETLVELFETTDVCHESWLDDHIQKRLQQLNALPTFREQLQSKIGKSISMDTGHKSGVIDSDKEEYAQKLKRFNKYITVTVFGFTDEDNREYKELKEWLTDNFKPEYVDLFSE